MAERLGMTVARLRQEMSHAEFVAWGGFFAYEAEEHEKAQRKANRGR